MTDPVAGPCPSCGAVATRTIYDVGDGPELSCANCEWCWGADGQPLSAIPPMTREWLSRVTSEVLRDLGIDPPDGTDG